MGGGPWETVVDAESPRAPWFPAGGVLQSRIHNLFAQACKTFFDLRRMLQTRTDVCLPSVTVNTFSGSIFLWDLGESLVSSAYAGSVFFQWS